MEAREVLEIAISRLALAHATEEDFRNVRQSGRKLEEAAREGSELLPYTMRVHLGIAQATHNTFLRRLFTDLLPWIMGRFSSVQIPPEDDVQMHIRLMEAFLARDQRKLLAAIRNHQKFWSMKFVEQCDLTNQTNQTDIVAPLETK